MSTPSIAVELFIREGFDAPVGAINLCIQELFPTILSTKKLPLTVDDFSFFVNPTKVDVDTDDQISVVLSLEPRKGIIKNGKKLTAALEEVLGNGVNIGVEIYFTQYMRVSRVTNRSKLPDLQSNPLMTAPLDQLFTRIVTEDKSLELDSSTGAIRLLAQEPELISAS
jgi:hypothetical protein